MRGGGGLSGYVNKQGCFSRRTRTRILTMASTAWNMSKLSKSGSSSAGPTPAIGRGQCVQQQPQGQRNLTRGTGVGTVNSTIAARAEPRQQRRPSTPNPPLQILDVCKCEWTCGEGEGRGGANPRKRHSGLWPKAPSMTGVVVKLPGAGRHVSDSQRDTAASKLGTPWIAPHLSPWSATIAS